VPRYEIAADRLAGEITASTQALADLIDGADLTRPVPTCPEWTLRQLAAHVGRVHRWAAQIVSTQAAQRLPFREVPDGKLPADPAEHPRWLRAGAERVLTALAETGTRQVWTHLGPGPASYWARRMAHETAVHRADAQITFGQRPVIDPDVAADGIDEWLGFIAVDGPGPQERRLEERWRGRAVHIHTTDDGQGGGEWTVRGQDGRLVVERGHSKGDVAVGGTASAVLLVLVRRFPPNDPDVEVVGDHATFGDWLAATAFE
jgi:uncharacterized protein (TIGR03083 family)